MKTSGLRVCSVFVGCVVIVGCSQSWEPSRLPNTANVSSVRGHGGGPLSYRLLWSFAGQSGNDPLASVIDVGGTLYGTTWLGGLYGNVFSFSVRTGAAAKTVHSFGGAPDGAGPSAALIDVNGTLYGTTSSGGEYNQGTVYSITTGGTEKVLYSFGSTASDGSEPLAALIYVKGTLYGTTFLGGASRAGTVFSITMGGTEKVLHSFGKGTDGIGPVGSLVDVGDRLYGTTEGGGRQDHCYLTCGTVFGITIDGKEKVLHSFGEGADGQYPLATLIDVDGMLYGTTELGGANYCSGRGCGTVFSITRGGSEKVLHSFNGTDGANPDAGLTNVGGTLYGTTLFGGAYDHSCCRGTVFRITTDGTEKVLHSFGSGTDGFEPAAGLYYKSGNLFGTTSSGGLHNGGTLFSLKP